MAVTCTRHMQNTKAGEAPRQRRVAMVAARPSNQVLTPPATPIPPTSSEVSPTRVRNRLVWSMNRPTPGAAWLASRMRQPLPGKFLRRSAIVVATSAPGGSRARNRYSTMLPGCNRPVAGRLSRPISTRGPKIEGSAIRSGSAVSVPRSTSRASPRRIASPSAARSRGRTSGSTRMPPRSASASFWAGCIAGAPTSGHAPSTAFSSTSARSPEGATSIERIVTTSDILAPRSRR